MYKGDSRTRTMEIHVDGDIQTTWTSSGTTSGFEDVVFEVSGQVVELRGVLTDSEWLSIMEVGVRAKLWRQACDIFVRVGRFANVNAWSVQNGKHPRHCCQPAVGYLVSSHRLIGINAAGP